MDRPDIKANTIQFLTDAPTFRPESPFREPVLAFLAATAGMTPVFDVAGYPNFMCNTGGRYPGFAVGEIQLNLDDIVQRIRSGEINQSATDQALSCMLATLAWERGRHGVKSVSESPAVKVLRCVRNAAAHNNCWRFRDMKEVPVLWRGLTIDPSLDGRRCFGETFHMADLLVLLADIDALLANAEV